MSADSIKFALFILKAVANIERAIIKSLEKQYNDILTPLKDSIPKRLNLHVQKLTRRQSTTLYSVPSPVSANGFCRSLNIIIYLIPLTNLLFAVGNFLEHHQENSGYITL